MELLHDIYLYLPAVNVAIAGLAVMMLSAFQANHQTVLWTSVFLVAVALIRAGADLFAGSWICIWLGWLQWAVWRLLEHSLFCLNVVLRCCCAIEVILRKAGRSISLEIYAIILFARRVDCAGYLHQSGNNIHWAGDHVRCAVRTCRIGQIR